MTRQKWKDDEKRAFAQSAALFERGHALLKEGAQALRLDDRATANRLSESALAAFSELMRAQPDNLLAMLYAGYALHNLGRGGEGSALFTRIVKIFDSLPHPTQKEASITAAALVKLSKQDNTLGNSSEAVEHAEKAFRLDPNDPVVMIACARAYTKRAAASGGRKADLKKARLMLKPVRDGNYPTSEKVEAFEATAEAHEAEGNTREALRFFNAALSLNLGHTKSLTASASLLAELGELDEAEKRYERALEIRSGFSIAQEGLERVRKLKTERAHQT